MLTASHAGSVAQAVVKARFKRAESVVEQGKKSSSLSIIFTGRACLGTCDARGREDILATLQPGDHIGQRSLIDNEPHSATVPAGVQTDVRMLGWLDFSRCLTENPCMTYAVM